MNTGKTLRIRRFFRHKRAVIIPMDHPMFGGPIPGLENPGKLLRLAARTEADGVLASPWAISRLAEEMGQMAFIARLDGGMTSLGPRYDQYWNVGTVEQAVRLGAEMVALNVFIGGENEPEMLKKLGLTAEACEQWGIPLMAEMIPAAELKHHFGVSERSHRESAGLGEPVSIASRIGAEYGGDIIKTVFSGNLEEFRRTILNSTVPVLLAGGPKTGSDTELLTMVKECLDAGAAGLVIGRNVWQRPRIEGMIAALCALTHEDASIEEALDLL